jgi:hypothetical protein
MSRNRPRGGPVARPQARPHAQGIQLPTVTAHGCARWIAKKPDPDHDSAESAAPQALSPNRRAAQSTPSAPQNVWSASDAAYAGSVRKHPYRTACGG